jgi:hypothetical protein
MCAGQSLLGNGSYLDNISHLNIQLLNCILNSITNERIEFKVKVTFRLTVSQ